MPDTVHPEIIELARRIATAHGLEPALVCAIIEQESAWNPWAVRYEPGFLSRYVAPLYTAGKLSATEAYTRSMSWGLMQVMGQVAREFGFEESSLAELCDPVAGVDLGCQILATRLARVHGDVDAALLAWNGGTNPDYPAGVLAEREIIHRDVRRADTQNIDRKISSLSGHPMKTTLHIVVLGAALVAIALLADAWRSSRRDNNQLKTVLTSQNASIQQAEAREGQRDVELTAALAAIAAQKRAVQTPQQAAQAIPSVLPPLPLPVSIQLPALSPVAPGETPPASIIVPQADLKPLYDQLQDCRANSIRNDATKKDLADEQVRTAALTHERDSAIAAAHGGTFWIRVKRSAKWFAIGVAAGTAAATVARHH